MNLRCIMGPGSRIVQADPEETLSSFLRRVCHTEMVEPEMCIVYHPATDRVLEPSATFDQAGLVDGSEVEIVPKNSMALVRLGPGVKWYGMTKD
jgi:hypothetical protein